MLENIMANEESDKQPDWKKAETENNIIAFCGERGEGKSSAMFTFINAVVNEKEQKESTIFAQCENVKNTVFSEPIVIDPSMFCISLNCLIDHLRMECLEITMYAKWQHARQEV